MSIVSVAAALAMVGALAVQPVIVARTLSIDAVAQAAVPAWAAARLARSQMGGGVAVAADPLTGLLALLPLEGVRAFLDSPEATPAEPMAAVDTGPPVAEPRQSGAAPRAQRPESKTREGRPGQEGPKPPVPAAKKPSHTGGSGNGHARKDPKDKKPPREERRDASAGSGGAWDIAPHVTWYGSDFFGNRTACGQRYSRKIIGVAHKTLPCGTLVQFRWNGITATAPVIDRGPYGPPGYVFDFSAALSCDVFRPKGVENGCFTRHDVAWRIVGRR